LKSEIRARNHGLREFHGFCGSDFFTICNFGEVANGPLFLIRISSTLDFNAYDEILAGEPDAGNPHVRFDEGEQGDRRQPPVALYSTG
jgi:hypothetical protein